MTKNLSIHDVHSLSGKVRETALRLIPADEAVQVALQGSNGGLVATQGRAIIVHTALLTAKTATWEWGRVHDIVLSDGHLTKAIALQGPLLRLGNQPIWLAGDGFGAANEAMNAILLRGGQMERARAALPVLQGLLPVRWVPFDPPPVPKRAVGVRVRYLGGHPHFPLTADEAKGNGWRGSLSITEVGLVFEPKDRGHRIGIPFDELRGCDLLPLSPSGLQVAVWGAGDAIERQGLAPVLGARSVFPTGEHVVRFYATAGEDGIFGGLGGVVARQAKEAARFRDELMIYQSLFGGR